MLELRRATVVEVLEGDGPEQRLRCDVEGGDRAEAVADTALVGPCEIGDELIVNVQARRLRLGSGGFDIVHANLSRGLGATAAGDAHVVKLNYTSLQHAVVPVEGERLKLPLPGPVGVLALHGQLAPVAWSFAQARPGDALGYVQTGGGALPGGHSRTVRELRERGLLAGHLTAAPAYGGEGEALTTIGALQHGLTELGWRGALCGPGPGIVGSGSALGHGGMAALDSAHAALALGCDTVVVARMSEADPRPRHKGLSHHTRTVLELVLASVNVALPVGCEAPDWGARHTWLEADPDLDGYAASGLSASTMGRGIDEDRLFFAAALAGGSALAQMTA
jgi:Protein of unknown function (DUF3866)